MRLSKIKFQIQYTGNEKKKIIESINSFSKDWNLKPNTQTPYMCNLDKVTFKGIVKCTSNKTFEVIITEKTKKTTEAKKPASSKSKKHWTTIVKEIQKKEGVSYAEAKEIYKKSK